MQLVQFAEPIPGQEPADVLRTAVFMANFAAQDITGRADASRGVAELYDALTHPAPDACTYIFAATTEQVAGPISALGYPLVPTSGDAAEPDVLGWLIATTPLADNTDVLELSLVLDVDLQPMEGQIPVESADTIAFLLKSAGEIAVALDRTILQLWQQYPLSSNSPYAEAFSASGFDHALAATEFVLPVSEEAVTDGVLVFANENFPAHVLNGVAALYSAASVDQPLGSLRVEREEWDAQRLAESTAHFRMLGTENFHALILDESDNVIALSELWIHADADPQVGVQGLTYVVAERRGEGLENSVATAALAAAKKAHPELSRVYASATDGHTSQLELTKSLGGIPVSRVGAWQRLIR